MTERPGSAFAATLLRSSARAYARDVVARMQATRGELLAQGLPATFASPVEDTEVRLLYLAEAVGVDRPVLMQHAAAWYRVAFRHRGVDDEYLPANLVAMDFVLRGALPTVAAEIVGRHIAAASEHLRVAPFDLPSGLHIVPPFGDLAARFLLAILERRGDDAMDLVRGRLDSGVGVEDLHDFLIVPVQREVGRMWLMGEIPIADEHFCSFLVDRVLSMLDGYVPRLGPESPRILTLGVGGDLHGIGLRLVAQRLQLAGFAVHHLGSNMPGADLEWALQDYPVDLVVIAATMTLHLGSLIDTVARVRRIGPLSRGDRRQIPILVGGEPFAIAPDLYAVVGADASAADAAGAVASARRLLRPASA